MTPEERQHENAVSAFFKQAVKDGRMTDQELRDVNGDGGRHRKKTLKVFEDFVIAACHVADRNADSVAEFQKAAMRIRIDIRLGELGLTRRHVELYINYPEWTERELAAAFSMKQKAVDRALARVRRSWPSFRLETATRQDDECPQLRHMDRIECSDTTDWLDENAIRQNF